MTGALESMCHNITAAPVARAQLRVRHNDHHPFPMYLVHTCLAAQDANSRLLDVSHVQEAR